MRQRDARLDRTEEKVVGQRFGRLVGQKLVVPRIKKTRAICLCDCGKTMIAETSNLLNGNTQSCGCLRNELIATVSRTHGKSNSKAFFTWSGIKARCYRPDSSSFDRYGARGIRMSDEWRNSFAAFYRDMGDPPNGLSIERIDNNGHYCKENCRWANRVEQGANKRNNIKLTFNEQTKTLSEWARELHCKVATLWARLFVQGWTTEKALSVPIRMCRRSVRPTKQREAINI